MAIVVPNDSNSRPELSGACGLGKTSGLGKDIGRIKMFGVIAVNKPQGWTSRDVVNRIQGLCKPHKCGHTGTLDPMATGVLLIAVGRSTRLVEFSHGADKHYVARFRLGCRSDSLDTDSEVTEVDEAPTLAREQFFGVLENWVGEIWQTPPKFSAVHINGKRAYDLARKGEEFEVPKRAVTIKKLDLREFDYPDVSLEVHCSTGTYIRTLGSDIARSLGSDAVMTELVRERVGSVGLADAIELDQLRSFEDAKEVLLPPTRLLSHLATVKLTEKQAVDIRNGIPIPLEGEHPSAPIVALDPDNRLAAILEKANKSYRSLRVFQKDSATTPPRHNSKPQSPLS